MADDDFMPRPPSHWHNSAYQSGSQRFTHDRMQEELLLHLRSRIIAGIPEPSFVIREVEGEYPFIRNGQVIAFADAVETLVINSRRFISIFEIKPKIDTVFGVVRQAKSLLELAGASVHADQHYLHLVVPANDPLIAGLRMEWPSVWAWGIVFEGKE